MSLRLHGRAVFLSFLVVTGAACNAVLDNHPGILDEAAEGGAAAAQGAGARDGGSVPPEGTATATSESGHDASDDLSPTAPKAPDAIVCAPGLADCNGNGNDGCETDLASVTSCGACGMACPADGPPKTKAACTGGACGFVCLPGRGDCNGTIDDGCEADLSKDRKNCGACGTYCVFGRCTHGVCTF